MKLAALAMCLICGTSQAQTQAYSGIAADGVSTAIGLARGAVELNPLGWATIPLRIGMVEYAKTLPREQGQPIIDATAAIGWGAALSNIVAPGVGLMVGLILWQQGSEERAFLDACARHKRVLPSAANLPCVWKTA